MEFIYGVTFHPFGKRGSLEGKKARESLRLLKERTAATHVILAPAGVQENEHAETINFTGAHTFSDAELCETIADAQSLGLHVILKPTVNCLNGAWRAYIRFFDHDVPGEAQWKRWFAAHEAFQLHYAEIAEKTGCVMFITGCEMVMAEHREAEWRRLIEKVRGVYHGPVSYNTNRYEEDNVTWWDCVDVISSSGYYPLGSWEQELDRIEAVVKRCGKPFFFAEAGCMSVRGSAAMPNEWTLSGEPDAREQAAWYRDMFAHTSRRGWMQGFGLWEWHAGLYEPENALRDCSYELYAKPAEEIVGAYYRSKGSGAPATG